jgi:hypothetical protein
MYYYRNLTPEQQSEVVAYRRQQRRPWHSPPQEKIWREYPVLDYGKKWDAATQSEPEESNSAGNHSKQSPNAL